jgi:hypothetical protein
MLPRLIAPCFVLLVLYYARFFVAVRQDTSTLVQIGILLLATAILLVPRGSGWRLSPVKRWAVSLVAVGLCVAIFVWADHDSHSVSDTLNRAVPAICLVLVLLFGLTSQGAGLPRASAKNARADLGRG